jgi:hypothetical protein
MRSGAEADMDPKDLDEKQIVRLHQLLHEAKFKDPDSSHLSPAGTLSPSPLPSSRLPFPPSLFFSEKFFTWRCPEAPLRSAMPTPPLI